MAVKTYYTKPTRRSVDCILTCGQSNDEGNNPTGSVSPIYLGAQANTKIYYKPNDPGPTNNGSWQNLQFGLNQNWRSAALDWVGPEISMGYSYYQQTGRELWILKYGYNGAALVDDGTPYTYGLWQWDANPANCNGLPHYSNFVNNFIIPAIIKARSNGIDLNIKAIHWAQGESSTNSAARSAVYQPTLISTIDRFITDLTPYNVLSPTFKPIISRVHNNFSPPRPYQNDIRTALVNVANYYNGYWIDTDSYALEADLIHFTKGAQEQQGIDVATILASM